MDTGKFCIADGHVFSEVGLTKIVSIFLFNLLP